MSSTLIERKRVIHHAMTIREFDSREEFDRWWSRMGGMMVAHGFSTQEVEELIRIGHLTIQDVEHGVPFTKTVVSIIT